MSVYQNLYWPQKVGDIWRIDIQAVYGVSLEKYVMYESVSGWMLPILCGSSELVDILYFTLRKSCS